MYICPNCYSELTHMDSYDEGTDWICLECGTTVTIPYNEEDTNN